jgi:cob(I)alamin adenosyltransferase
MAKRMGKLYTRTGDSGKTGLFSGERVPKNDPRVEAYGTVDELSSFLGILKTALDARKHGNILDELTGIQKDLLCIGSQLSIYPDKNAAGLVPGIEPDRTRELEHSIDSMDSSLEPLSSFILPGGHPTAAWAHVCRVVCRRAERQVVALKSSLPEISGEDHQLYRIIAYLNRLSDYFFALARYCNALHQVKDVLWEPQAS